MGFKIDPGFEKLSFQLGKLAFSHVLLMNNAEIPWFMLVPETSEVELCDLEPEEQQRLLTELNAMSVFVRKNFTIDKLNIAANGNVIRQMHWHVIGRRFDDFCWPDVVWGKQAPSIYSDQEVAKISALLSADTGLTQAGYKGV